VLSKLKFSIKDLLIAFLALFPIFVLAVAVYNPAERDAIARDKESSGLVSYMARLINQSVSAGTPNPYKLSEPNCSGDEKTCYLVSGSGYVVFTKAQSLAWRQYCLDGTAFITYSSSENRTDIVCALPTPGLQEFVN
jgi:hypothetical protein